jgi:GDP-D-mannose dehydratase
LSFRKIELKVDKNLIRNNDIPLLTGSAQKFIKETGWKPQIDFYATLTDLLDYYRTIIKK